jgi:hypothetical protein
VRFSGKQFVFYEREEPKPPGFLRQRPEEVQQSLFVVGLQRPDLYRGSVSQDYIARSVNRMRSWLVAFTGHVSRLLIIGPFHVAATIIAGWQSKGESSVHKAADDDPSL